MGLARFGTKEFQLENLRNSKLEFFCFKACDPNLTVAPQIWLSDKHADGEYGSKSSLQTVLCEWSTQRTRKFHRFPLQKKPEENTRGNIDSGPQEIPIRILQ